MELLYADMGGWCPLGRIQFGRDGEEAGGMGLKAANQEGVTVILESMASFLEVWVSWGTLANGWCLRNKAAYGRFCL